MQNRSGSASRPAGPTAEPASAGSLENYANNFSPLRPSTSLRELRYGRRGVLWAVSSLDRVRKCGRVRHDGQGVMLRQHEGIPGFAGVCTCGSVWSCPVCNAKIMSRRALELGVAVATWREMGGHAIFATFTMRHHRGQSLADLWDKLSKAWHAVTAGKQWQRDCARWGVAGFVKVVEVTYGEHGWHAHVHALVLLLDGAPHSRRDVEHLQARMFGRWSRALVRMGLEAPLSIAQDAHLVTGPADAGLAEYFTKSVDAVHRIGLELTASQSKRVRSSLGTRSTWYLLDEVVDMGVLDGWHEWEAASKGRRQIAWSKGLRERLGLRREHSDEEIAAEEIGSSSDDLVMITAAGWETLCRCPANLGRLLDVVQAGGLDAAVEFLGEHGVSHVVIGGTDDDGLV